MRRRKGNTTKMALAFAAGAAILAAGVTAASKDPEIELENVELQEIKTKGMLEGTYKANLAFAGATDAFGPYPAPPQDLKSVTGLQAFFAKALTETNLQMARYNMRPKGDNQRIPIASAENTPYLVQKAKSRGGIGDIKNSETLNTYAMTHTRHNTVGSPIGWALIKRGEESGYNEADDASRRYRPPPGNSKNYTYNFYRGVTFNDRVNPWTRSSKQVTMQAKAYADAQGRTLPSIGNLVPVKKSVKFNAVPFTGKI
jgi:hypothetical protein